MVQASIRGIWQRVAMPRPLLLLRYIYHWDDSGSADPKSVALQGCINVWKLCFCRIEGEKYMSTIYQTAGQIPYQTGKRYNRDGKFGQKERDTFMKDYLHK